MRILLASLILISCAVFVVEMPLVSFDKSYSYTDTSGSYVYKKRLKFLKDEMITRVQLRVSQKGKDLERTTSVSKLKNRDKKDVALLPRISEHKVWFSKKMYYSKIEAISEKKVYRVTMSSPEEKWNGIKEFKVPDSKKICWFSQLAECVKLLKLLDNSGKESEFYIIWDSYPYHTEQLNNVSEENLFSRAKIKFDSNYGTFKRFEVSFNNTNMILFYTPKKEFKKLFWISEGISLINKD